MAKENINSLITRLNKSTLSIRKVGRKYRVKDTVEYDGDYGMMTAKQIKKMFG